METKANHFLIGIFVLALSAAVFGFIFWIKNIGAGQNSASYYIIFQGSVGGLGQASDVLFNGIKIGKVRHIEIDPGDSRKVRVLVNVKKETPIRINSRARVEQQGLTGFAAVQISPGTPDAQLLARTNAKPYPVIKADRALSTQSLLDSAPEVLGNANALFVRLNDLIANNEDSIRRTITNIEAFSKTLEANKGDINAIIKDTKALSAQFRTIATKLDAAVSQVSGFLSGDSKSFVEQAKKAITTFQNLATKLDNSLGDGTDGMVRMAKESLQEFQQFMRDGRRAVRNFDKIMEQIDRNPQAFIFGEKVPEYKPRQ